MDIESQSQSQLARHNLGLYRLHNFVGRSQELQQLKIWLEDSPVVAITGPSGAGKSTLATALAVQEAARFDAGILWISASGATEFNFYDIVRAFEDVLAAGIFDQPVSSWPLFVLQQLYGASRLLVMDELTEADPAAVTQIIDMIGQIQPGRRGRFVLVGRDLPQPLLDIVGPCHLVLNGLDIQAVEAWTIHHESLYPLTPKDAPRLHQLTGGHPLALKMAAGLWHTAHLKQLEELVSVQEADDWEAKIRATVVAALASLDQTCLQAGELLVRCTQASGGFDGAAIENIYWRLVGSDMPLAEIIQTLTALGLLLHNNESGRYFIHPLIRRYLSQTDHRHFPRERRWQQISAFVQHYVAVARRYEETPPEQVYLIDHEWGNIRKAVNFLVDSLEETLNGFAEEIITTGQDLDSLTIPFGITDILVLIRDYGLALRTSLVIRHPPEGFRWLSAAVIASRHLADQQAEGLIGQRLAAVAYARQEYGLAEAWYRRSLNYFRSVDDRPRTIQLLKNLADSLKAADRFDEALEIDQEALQIASREEIFSEHAAIFARIGSIYFTQKAYTEAITWYQQALDLDETQGNEDWQAIHHNSIGLAFEANEQFKEAIEHYKKSAELHLKAENLIGLSAAYGNLGAAYYTLGHPQEALQWYEQDLTIAQNLGNWFDLAAILHNMGHVALELDNLPAAADYFTRSRDIYRQFGQLELAEEEQLLLDTIADRQAR